MTPTDPIGRGPAAPAQDGNPSSPGGPASAGPSLPLDFRERIRDGMARSARWAAAKRLLEAGRRAELELRLRELLEASRGASTSQLHDAWRQSHPGDAPTQRTLLNWLHAGERLSLVYSRIQNLGRAGGRRRRWYATEPSP